MKRVSVPFAFLRNRLGPFSFAAIRGLERKLSASSLYSALLPFALTAAGFSETTPLPGYFPSVPARRLRTARANYFLGRVLEFFPDRLSTPKWKTRFETIGLHYLEQARRENRCVVLVCFHFGTFKLIPFWLRALGFPVIGLLKGHSGQRSPTKRMKDRLSPFPTLPTVLYTQDQMRAVVEFLLGGNLLLLTADRETGRQLVLPIDQQWSFGMATGAIRLAARSGAELIPCRMTDEGRWNFKLVIGPPIPQKYLAATPDVQGAGQNLLEQMLPAARKHPELCSHYLLDCFQRRS